MPRTWSYEEFKILEDLYPLGGYQAVRKELESFGFYRSKSSVHGMASKYGIKFTGDPEDVQNRKKNAGSFGKGHVPWNKGMRLVGNINSGTFRKGQMPVNHLPVGSIRWRKNTKRGGTHRFLWIKVEEPNKWKLLQRWMWTQFYGPIEPGMIVTFIDQDHSNVSIDNLELITRLENLRRNRNQEKIEAPKKLLSDSYICGLLKRGTDKPGSYFLQFPELIEAKRQELILKREIENYETQES